MSVYPDRGRAIPRAPPVPPSLPLAVFMDNEDTARKPISRVPGDISLPHPSTNPPPLPRFSVRSSVLALP